MSSVTCSASLQVSAMNPPVCLILSLLNAKAQLPICGQLRFVARCDLSETVLSFFGCRYVSRIAEDSCNELTTRHILWTERIYRSSVQVRVDRSIVE